MPGECVDLIYLDPPFNSNHNYVAAFGDKGTVDAQLRDIWRWTVETENTYQRLPHGKLLDAINAIRLVSGDTSPMAAYALFMGRRLAELHRVLKPTGSIYLHCNDTAHWLLRIMLDTVFGDSQRRNEIEWVYRRMAAPRQRRFNRCHDTILYYAKTSKFTFNSDDVRLPYAQSSIDRAGYRKTSLGGAAPESETCELNDKGRFPEDWWEIPFIRPNAKERVGYPTQKPLALLERIIKASSNEGDLVLDPFCGCGTAADAAATLGRGYLGIDVSAIAVRVMEQRLKSRGEARGWETTPVVYRMGWEDYDWKEFERRALMLGPDAEDGLPGWAWAEDKVAGLLNAVPNSKKVGDGGFDARYFTEANEVIPIQVKMHEKPISRPELDKLLGVQTSWQNQKVNAPMSLMVTLYPPRESLRVFAARQGRVTLRGEEYPKMQVLSVQEMLTKQERPKLPPVDPRYFVGDTQTSFVMAK